MATARALRATLAGFAVVVVGLVVWQSSQAGGLWDILDLSFRYITLYGSARV